jgi:hypothetical protein
MASTVLTLMVFTGILAIGYVSLLIQLLCFPGYKSDAKIGIGISGCLVMYSKIKSRNPFP